jgi:regulatory factor X 1/2/3
VRIFHRNFIFTKLPLKTVYGLLLHDLANLILKNIFYILLHLLQEQASWVCQCEDTVVQQLQEDFKQTLERQNSLEQYSGGVT